MDPKRGHVNQPNVQLNEIIFLYSYKNICNQCTLKTENFKEDKHVNVPIY